MGWGRTEQRRSGSSSKQGGQTSCVLAFLLAGLQSHIEEAFSKIKALVRKEGARVREAVREALVEAIGRALAAITPEDAAGWFAHAGYLLQDQPL